VGAVEVLHDGVGGDVGVELDPRPSPKPRVLRPSLSRPRPNFSKILVTSSGWMPGPRSATFGCFRSSRPGCQAGGKLGSELSGDSREDLIRVLLHRTRLPALTPPQPRAEDGPADHGGRDLRIGRTPVCGRRLDPTQQKFV